MSHRCWVAVKGEAGKYAISNDGMVLSFKRSTPKLLKGWITPDGYPSVKIGNRRDSLHAFIAESFMGPRPFGLQVNHKDGNKANSNVSNLEYVTPKENILHSVRIGLRKSYLGEIGPNARLTWAEVESIRSEYVPRKVTLASLGTKYGVSEMAIFDIIHNKRWKVKKP